MVLEKIKIGLIDDHVLFRKGLISLLEASSIAFRIVFEAENGSDMIKKLSALSKNELPDVVLLDINMPEMDGYSSAEWIKENIPDIKVIVLSMVESEEAIIRMLKLGAKAYLTKDIETGEFAAAINSVMNKGFYFSDLIATVLLSVVINGPFASQQLGKKLTESLSERELKFIKLAVTELTYVEIAEEMFLSPRTIDGYKNTLFEKCGVNSRVGLAMYAVKNNLVKI